jgi:hypothetical protein
MASSSSPGTPANLPAYLADGLRRAMKGAAPKSAKEARAVLIHLGVRTWSVVKQGQKVVGYNLNLPAGAPFPVYSPRKIPNYSKFQPDQLWGSGNSLDGLDYTEDREEARAVSAKYRAWLQQAAAEALGGGAAEKLARERQGLPVEDRSADPNVRTCGACWRDIKATASSGMGGRDPAGARDGRFFRYLVDHGYSQREGWGRSGSCVGVATLPWEESDEAVRKEIAALERESRKTTAAWKGWAKSAAQHAAGDYEGLPEITKRGRRRHASGSRRSSTPTWSWIPWRTSTSGSASRRAAPTRPADTLSGICGRRASGPSPTCAPPFGSGRRRPRTWCRRRVRP